MYQLTAVFGSEIYFKLSYVFLVNILPPHFPYISIHLTLYALIECVTDDEKKNKHKSVKLN